MPYSKTGPSPRPGSAICLLLLALAVLTWTTAAPGVEPNLCPNPNLETPNRRGNAPAGWTNQNGGGAWTTDETRSGNRSLRLVCTQEATRMWTSDAIPVTDPSREFFLSVWAKLDRVRGGRGAMMVLYHLDAEGERIGQSAIVNLGGDGDAAESTPWQRYVGKSDLTPEVRAVRVNLRLYRARGTVWFDDVALRPFDPRPLARPTPLRRGLDLTNPAGIAVVSPAGGGDAADRVVRALEARGVNADRLHHGTADARQEFRDLIVLGNLATSTVCARLYHGYHTFEDTYFPGSGGYVLRPLVNPFGNGTNMLVLGASDQTGLERGLTRLLALLSEAGPLLTCPLEVRTGNDYRGHTHFPWPVNPPWDEIRFAADYLKSGNLDHARRYRDYVLEQWPDPAHRKWNHLFYVTKTLSWELMHTCDIFSDQERLKLTNELLKHLRGDQGIGYLERQVGRRQIKENHATRSARAFYFGWRHLDTYYREQMPDEVQVWRSRLRDFWTLCLSSPRSREDSLSQHALGGSLDNLLDIALMEPEWAADFWRSSRPRLMLDRCTIICNNMGQTVMLGDTGDTDYPTSVFAKLAYALNDGGARFMIEKRLPLATATDEPLRGFNAGVQPRQPDAHLGLAVCPGDPLYFRTELVHRMGVSAAEGFDKLAFRSGFAEDDAYLMLDGVSGGSHSYNDVNTIGEFSANRRRWLLAIDRLKGPSMAFHNGVTVARHGFGPKTHGQAAALLARDQGPRWAYTATRVPKLNGVDWNRHIVWMHNDFFFVVDEMQAREEGDFSFVATWRGIGSPKLEPGQFSATQDRPARPPGMISLSATEIARRASAPAAVPFGYRADWDGILVRSERPGDYLEMPLSIPQQGTYQVSLETYDMASRGIIAVLIDGVALGPPVDMYAPDPVASTHDLGPLRLARGEHRVRLEVTGKRPESRSMLMGVRAVNLRRPHPRDAAAGAPVLNRFWQQFDSGQAATLERDTELLGPDLPHNPYADQALNILEQTLSRPLAPGQTACFQNLFHARRGHTGPSYAYKRLNEHCALVRDARGVALIGAAIQGVEAQVGALRASGRMFYLGPAGVILHQATAQVGNERLLGALDCPPAVMKQLNQAWISIPDHGTARALRAEKQPRHDVAWQADLDAIPRSVIVRRSASGPRIAVGLESGAVLEFSGDGRWTTTFTTGGPVHALETYEEVRDGPQDLLVGSDDETLYRLGENLEEKWRRPMPFVRFDGIPMHWTLRAAKIRGLLSANLAADRGPDILVGTGSMHLHCLDGQGNERWRTPVPSGARWTYGIPDTLAVADVFADGNPRVLVGNGLKSYSAWCTVLDQNGSLMQQYKNGGWAIACTAIAAADLDRDGDVEVYCGNSLGDLRCFRGQQGKPQQRWWHNLSRTIRSFAVIPADDADRLAVASESGCLTVFDADGNALWGHGLSSATLRVAIVDSHGTPRLLAACRDGVIAVFTADGAPVGQYDIGGQIHDVAVGDVNMDGHEDIVAVTSSPHRLTACRLPR